MMMHILLGNAVLLSRRCQPPGSLESLLNRRLATIRVRATAAAARAAAAAAAPAHAAAAAPARDLRRHNICVRRRAGHIHHRLHLAAGQLRRRVAELDQLERHQWHIMGLGTCAPLVSLPGQSRVLTAILG